MFSSAKKIVGVGSSAFTNTIFSGPEVNILAFVPNNRSLDTGMTKFNKFLNQNSYFFSGIDKDPSSLNTAFEIDLEELKCFCKIYNF